MLFSGKLIQLEKNLHDRRSRQISKSVGAQCPGVMKNRYLLKNHVPSQNIRVQTAIRPDEYDNIKNIYSPKMFPTQPVVRPDDPIKAIRLKGLVMKIWIFQKNNFLTRNCPQSSPF